MTNTPKTVTTEEKLRSALEQAVFFLERVRNGDLDPKACSFADCLVEAAEALND